MTAKKLPLEDSVDENEVFYRVSWKGKKKGEKKYLSEAKAEKAAKIAESQPTKKDVVMTKVSPKPADKPKKEMSMKKEKKTVKEEKTKRVTKGDLVMQFLGRKKRAFSIKDISVAIEMTNIPNLHAVIDSLVKKGLVTKQVEIQETGRKVTLVSRAA